MLVGETNENGVAAWSAVSALPDWREVDRRLRGIARRKGALDREEIVALRDAMRVQVWREVGCASMREYLERVFGYGPRAASDRLRVAAALDAMPVLEDALDAGELPYSGVREIARVATSGTADAWVEACRGKCLRDIEELVAQHAAGDRPDSPPREHERPQILRLELEGSDYALWRQARQIVEGERDEAVSDRELFATVCTALIERGRELAADAVSDSQSGDGVRMGSAAHAACRAHVGNDSAPSGRVDNESEVTERVCADNESAPIARTRRALDCAHVGSNAGSADRVQVGNEAAPADRVDNEPSPADRAHVGNEAAPGDRVHVGTGRALLALAGDESAPTEHIEVDDVLAAADHPQLNSGDAGPDQIEGDGGGRSAQPKRGTQRLGSDAQRGRAKYQIAVVVCEACKRGWQEGGGKRIPISAADVARAECDAQRIGSLDGEPAAVTQDVSPKTRRFVWRRDGDRCTVPGCRASSFIEVHHIVHREHGGGNEAENLTLLCGGHHDAHHAGNLVIRGRAPDLTFELAGERPKSGAHLGASVASNAADEEAMQQMRADAVLALYTLGFKKPEAIAAVEAALAAEFPPCDLEALLRLALRHCPK
jgi:hypothetical protein